jgi:Hint-domain/VWA / Hh  protein intein-like/von Willebrand factor type A domain
MLCYNRFSLSRSDCHLGKRFCSHLPSVPQNNHNHLSSSKKTNQSLTPNLKHLSPLGQNIKLSDKVSFEVSHSSISIEDNKHLFNVKIEADSKIVKPATFICTLDISDSMNGPCTNIDPEAAKFSRLDLVKHSMNTIVHCLRPEDKLAIVVFSNDASKLLNLSQMNEAGKKSALHTLARMRADGQTNLWDGLKMSLDEIDGLTQNQSENKFTLLFSDGCSNRNPPKGIMHELLQRKSQSPLISSLHSFGYGYDVDSQLLNEIVIEGGGLFAHIPDHSMCNTVFINFLSNCLTTAINKVHLKLSSIHGCQNINMWNHSFNQKGIIDIGAIQTGQSRNVIFDTEINDPHNFSMDFNFEYENQRYNYAINKLNQGYLKQLPHTNSTNQNQKQRIVNILQTSDMAFQVSKAMLLRTILNGLKQTDLRKTCLALDVLYEMIEEFNKLSTHPEQQNQLQALMRNIKSNDSNEGQIYKAFSKQEWFDRWGIHYLKYFVRSHQMQVCSNFKDASLQLYGGQLFKEVRTEVEDIFSHIPIPQPSLSSDPYGGNYTQSFYSKRECFDGEGYVKLANREVKMVKELIKGDRIVNSDGNEATILCVLKIKGDDREVKMNVFSGVKITEWHPVRINKEWKFPSRIIESIPIKCDYTYNIVLDKHHIMTINNLDVITLGHNYTQDPVLAHPFFGSQKVIDNLKTHSGWNNGLIEITNYQPQQDENGLISAFF